MPANIQKTHEEIEIDRETFFKAQDAAQILKYRDYALGKQPKTLTAEQQALLEGILGNDFCDNVCHQILSEDADRLELLRFNVADETVQKWIDDWFTRQNLDDESGETHYAALRDGNYAVSLSWSDEYQRVCLHREPWWNGNVGVFVAYDAVGEPLYAVKDWDAIVDGIMARRRLIWYEDRLERYINLGGITPAGFQPYTLPGENDHMQDWTKPDGSPLHIPVIHFANAGRGPANYGTSEIAGGVLGFQDQINDLQYDITAAARMTAFQMLWTRGAGQAVDEEGTPVDLKVGPGVVFNLTGDHAGAGVLPAGDMSQLIAVYMQKMRAVSRMTRTPLHTITGGDWPSGKALERSEMPLVQKCARQIKKFKTAWATVAHRATEIANVFAKANLNEEVMIEAEFENPTRPDGLAQAQENLEFWRAAYQAALAGYPVDLYLKREGWQNDAIEEFLVRAEELAAAQAAVIPASGAATVVPGATAAASLGATKGVVVPVSPLQALRAKVAAGAKNGV